MGKRAGEELPASPPQALCQALAQLVPVSPRARAMQASRCPHTYCFLPFFPFAYSNPQPLEQIIKIHLYLICLLELIEFLRLANVTQYAMPPNRDWRCRCRGCSPEALPPWGHPWGQPSPKVQTQIWQWGHDAPSSVAPGFQGPHMVRLQPRWE